MGTPLEVTAELLKLLEPLTPDDRVRSVTATFALLGQVAPVMGSGSGATSPGGATNTHAERWMAQNSVSASDMEGILHIADGTAEIIVGKVPGETKKQQTINCYVLVGLREFFKTGAPKFSEGDVVAFCQHMGCYDPSNHASNRKAVGNLVLGNKDAGYTLPAPGLKAAADLVKRLIAA